MGEADLSTRLSRGNPPPHAFAMSSALALAASFDGGLPGLAEADEGLGVCRALAACVPEWRTAPIRHPLEALVRQRVFQIACGYEHQYDADTLLGGHNDRLLIFTRF